MAKKVAIIGQGTAGVFALSHFSKWTQNFELELHADPNIKPQPVGEGSTLVFPVALEENLNFNYGDLEKLDGSLKYGIKKTGWSTGKEYVHEFKAPFVSYHFNAGKLQKYVLEKLQGKFKLVEGNVASHNDIDADYIMDCAGRPKSYDEFTMCDSIAVNAVHVNQCYWDYPRFNYTLTLARPYGWVFGIPLRNRCSIGYMYNNKINTLEEVKEDMKQVFADYNLTPSQDTNTFSFGSYYRNKNFTNRVIYSGNNSFFLEPMEATSISTMDWIQRKAFDVWFGGQPCEMANKEFATFIEEIENVIMLHYCNGSVFDTEFWRVSQAKAEAHLANSLPQDKTLDAMIEKSKADWNDIKNNISNDLFMSYGTWPLYSFHQNLTNLCIHEKLKALKNSRNIDALV
jgi:hypothetical protein